mmetsp:Transcript_47698/g.78932  ORF Transcript_47698/g.78932 Transcript_47698/m.78932 type:complete len:109 (-) Transcript_47698:52-378(-)|eukprot:CAMPEP_0119308322 /NCGR_PEP_ID=MMETSP1333-20130426/10028_1 /TAXON_ID=418940 /ORGANISM="Scyphosphaera apsteinii, Strain RCC1455" /LENGTH=108 /DNA_ID=CAMNT_0007312065 /DNA_START=107 /DNA_END=433 /DNA_ORIENTATION=-
MPTTIRFIGPDLPSEFTISVDCQAGILQVKEAALAQWPSGMPAPAAIQQLRIIHAGRILTDDKSLKDCRVAENETTAMHLVIKAADLKPSDSQNAECEKPQKCKCIIC